MPGCVPREGARGRTPASETAARLGKKPLPRVVKEVEVESDYALVKFRGEDEAYKAHGQPVWFKVVNYGALPAQVQVHLGLQGVDEKRRRERMIDVDFYLSVEESRRAFRLLRGLEFKLDRIGVVRAGKRT